MKKHHVTISMIFCLLVSISGVYAQKDMQQYNTMLLIDGSSHANARWSGTPKIKVFRQALGETLAVLNKSPAWGFNMGIRVFGDKSLKSVNDCLDSRLGNKIDWFEPVVIKSVVEGIRPKGKNCLAYSISTAKDDFPKSIKNTQNYLVAIVSSRDECTKDEKETLDWIRNQVQMSAIYIVGMNVSKKDAAYFETLFENIPGEFLNVTQSDQLSPTLTKVLNQYCRGIQPVEPVEEMGDASDGSKKPVDSGKTKPAESGQPASAAPAQSAGDTSKTK